MWMKKSERSRALWTANETGSVGNDDFITVVTTETSIHFQFRDLKETSVAYLYFLYLQIRLTLVFKTYERIITSDDRNYRSDARQSLIVGQDTQNR